MSNKSNNHGRAFEFICLRTLEKEIKKIRSLSLTRNSSFKAAERSWNTLSPNDQKPLKKGASVAIKKIFELEPLITEKDNDSLEILLQSDQNGIEGDVRDLLIRRSNIQWEIGLSLKHNHFAVKHSRISQHLDFGQSWYGVPCSNTYWNEVSPIFDYLANESKKNIAFCQLPNKHDDIYKPLLTAFMNEIKRQNEVHKDIPGKLVEYLLGKFDFYKVISIDKQRLSKIQPYNIHGTLNQQGRTIRPTSIIPIIPLPKRIVHFDFAIGKSTTVELYMDSGWQFSFRIHNASTRVEPSLKFDIQAIGMPTAILTINCNW